MDGAVRAPEAPKRPTRTPREAAPETAERISPSHPAMAAVASTTAFDTLARGLPESGTARTVGGAVGSLPLVTVAALATRLPHRLWVVAAASPSEASEYFGDLETLLGPDLQVHYPQRENHAGDGHDPRAESSGPRVEAFEAFLGGQARIMVATRRALQEVAPLPDDLAEQTKRALPLLPAHTRVVSLPDLTDVLELFTTAADQIADHFEEFFA